MRILGLYNIKGGVGKTAAAVNLAWLAAHDGYRTLLWDLDPQAAATFYFRIQPGVAGGGKRLIKGKTELNEVIRGTDYDHLDLLPADFSYRNLDLALDDAKKPAKQLLKLLRPLSTEYDYLFLDCPPSISLVSENVFRAADALLIPTIPTTLSLRTYEQLLEFFQGREFGGVRLMPFFSLVDRRKGMHLKMLAELPARFPELLASAIPNASDVERMGLQRAPVETFAPHSAAAEAYRALWGEVKGRLSGW